MANTNPSAVGSASQARERVVVMGGIIIVALALLFAYGVVPFVQRWQVRETQLAAVDERVRFLEGLWHRTANLEQVADRLESVVATEPLRVIHARSDALAASQVQAFLQDAADASHVVVTRLDVTPQSAADSVVNVGMPVLAPSIPASLSGYGDIRGVTELLTLVSSGPRVLVVDQLTLIRNAALLGAPDVVQFTLTLRAPVLPE